MWLQKWQNKNQLTGNWKDEPTIRQEYNEHVELSSRRYLGFVE